jgi:hypothetical protein
MVERQEPVDSLVFRAIDRMKVWLAELQDKGVPYGFHVAPGESLTLSGATDMMRKTWRRSECGEWIYMQEVDNLGRMRTTKRRYVEKNQS